MKRSVITKQLIQHEDIKLKPYRDTRGHLTIGVGRNLEAEGIYEDEALLMLDNDITDRWKQLTTKFTWFGALDDTRQHVIIDMAFNMGVEGLAGFKKMIAAIEACNFEQAAIEILDSDFARQTGQRAKTLAAMMRDGLMSTIGKH